ncbi:MAG: HMA2 domain-containing protein [bacterium]
MTNSEGIKIVHAIPGRVRIKVPKMRQNSALEANIRNRLSNVQIIQRVETNLFTGSILLHYSPEEIDQPGILFSLADSFISLFPEIDFEKLQTSLTSPASSAASPSLTASRISEFSGTLNDQLKKAGIPDLRILLPLTLLAFGMRGLLVAESVAVPTWYDFLWFSFGTFFMLNPLKDRQLSSSK